MGHLCSGSLTLTRRSHLGVSYGHPLCCVMCEMIVACSVDCYNSINKGSSLRLLLKFQKKHLPSYGEKETLCCTCLLSYYLGGSFNHVAVLPLIALMYPLAICYWCCHGRIYTPCVYVLCSTGTVVGCNLSQYIVCVLVIPWSRPAGQSHSIPYTWIEHFNRSRVTCTDPTVAFLAM
jgi:hypothetical protein